MEFNIDRKTIKEIARDKNFTPNNVEKVLRLCIILNTINRELTHSQELLLKGGTGINLLGFSNSPRLSVDLDLDYGYNIDKEAMQIKRSELTELLTSRLTKAGYEVSERPRFRLDGRELRYQSVLGGKDKIKLDINYHTRSHIYPAATSMVRAPFGLMEMNVKVAHLDMAEMYGSKISALYDRCTPRDIFDIYSLATTGLLSDKPDRERIRKAAIFYSSLNDNSIIPIIEKDIYAEIKLKKFAEMRDHLMQMMHTGLGYLDTNKICTGAIDYLKDLMVFNIEEKEYIARLQKGEIRPDILFGHDIGIRLKYHPGVLFKSRKLQMNGINQHKGKGCKM